MTSQDLKQSFKYPEDHIYPSPVRQQADFNIFSRTLRCSGKEKSFNRVNNFSVRRVAGNVGAHGSDRIPAQFKRFRLKITLNV